MPPQRENSRGQALFCSSWFSWLIPFCWFVRSARAGEPSGKRDETLRSSARRQQGMFEKKRKCAATFSRSLIAVANNDQIRQQIVATIGACGVACENVSGVDRRNVCGCGRANEKTFFSDILRLGFPVGRAVWGRA